MFDFVQNGALPRYTTRPCWWCRNKFSSHPIGCPIIYHPEPKSEEKKLHVLDIFRKSNLPVDNGTDFFETEGLFCTFPCVKAYILDQIARTKSIKYAKALTLLTLLYSKLVGDIAVIPVAPSWKVLIEWGGHLTPQEYRSSMGLLEYIETVNTKRPYMYPSSAYIQEIRVKV